MTLRQDLDRIAVSLSFAEPEDLSSLREVQESLTVLAQGGAAEELPPALTRAFEQGAARLASLVGGAEADPDAALSFVSQAIDFAAEVLTAMEGGSPVEDLTAPWEVRATPASTATGPASVDADLVEMFVSECGDTLHALEVQLLELAHEPNPKETIAEIRRRIHTFKGECGVLSLHTAQALCHEAETLIDRSEEADALPIDLLLELVDWLQGHVLELKHPGAAKSTGEAELLKRLQLASHEDGAQQEVAPTAVEAPEQSAPASTPAQASTPPAQTAAAERKPEAPRKPAARQPAKQVQSEGLVRIGTKRLDALVDMVGELVIAQQMIQETPSLEALTNEGLTTKLGHVAKITRDLQEGAMSLRMVTLKPTFQKMARLVRDVAAKSGKQVNLRLVGEDTELDRNVVEHIGDPLVHLIRNSIDHGLEPAEERQASGKPEQGTLELKAYHQGGAIVIEVRDDGRGLDCDRILAKALERGLVPEGTTREDLSDAEIHKMIFQAGFSTAATVSDISGRGVGMDVVRRQIESMRGKVEIRSKAGEGSTISLRLPLTLAVIDGMVVRVGRHRYVLPTLAIEQSFRPTPSDLHSVAGSGQVVEVHGKLLPVHSLKEIFDLPEGVDEIEQGILLLIGAYHERACFLVDEIIGQRQVVIRSLGKALPALEGVSGGAILGDGIVALILDVEGLLSRTHCVPA